MSKPSANPVQSDRTGSVSGLGQNGHVLHAGRNVWRNMPIGRPAGTGWMLSFTIAGRAIHQHPSGTSFHASAGDLVLFGSDAGVGRGTAQDEEWNGFWLRFEPWTGWRPDGFERVADRLYRTHISFPGLRQRVHDVWERIIMDVNARHTAYVLGTIATKPVIRNPGSEAVEAELVVHRLREIFLLVLLESTAPSIDARITAVLEAMERDIARPLDMDKLAASVGLSYSRFAHLFKSQLGASPKRVQILIRLRRAAVQLENSDDPVGLIAERTGFSSIFDFSRSFHREYGISPTGYRADHQ